MSSRFGVSTEKIKALNDFAQSPLFSDAEKVALERGADADHRVGERILALQPGVPHPIARVLEAMTASDGFAEFLSDQLAPLGRITMRRMFGKTGVFCDGFMLGMVSDNTLYFRVDDDNRTAFKGAAP